MRSMSLLKAADLAAAAYKGGKLPPIKKTINEGHVQAYLLTDMTLVIRGSDELKDYTHSNLVVSKGKISWPGMSSAAQNALWHKGFAGHAQTVAHALNGARPKFIVGHSLGAATAQILGCVYGAPTVAFASPKPLQGKATLTHEKWVLNVLRNDDLVCRVPLSSGYRRVGNTEVMKPKGINVGEDHSMKQYIKLLKTELAEGKIIKSWPFG